MEIKESDYKRAYIVIILNNENNEVPVILKPYNQAHISGNNNLVRTYYYSDHVLLRVQLSKYEIDVPELKVVFHNNKTYDIKINYEDLVSINIEYYDVDSRYIQECQRHYHELYLQTTNLCNKSRCLGDLEALAKLKESILKKELPLQEN